MKKPKDLSNKRFGKLIAIELLPVRKNRHAVWKCQCDCGNICEVIARNLNSGGTQSCGCLKATNMIGMKFGKLTVIQRIGSNKSGHATWKCLCDCGNEIIVYNNLLTQGHKKSCGCLHGEDLTGQRFGRLIAITPLDKRDKCGSIIWKCKCDCGNTHDVSANCLKNGKTQSCGCYKREIDKIRAKNLGKRHINTTREKLIYCEGTMIQRISGNRKIAKNNNTGVTGVYERKGKYIAQIGFKGEDYYLGTYDNFIDAVKAREVAEKQIFGEFLKWYNSVYIKKQN